MVAYVGNEQRFKAKVLRIPKSSQNIENIIKFYQVGTLLFSEDWTLDMHPISVNVPFLRELSDLIQKDRPLDRLGSIYLGNTLILMMNNLSTQYSVEIKPKWGFKPRGYTGKCRFCLHNQLKSENNLNKKSLFCPMDLYSDDINRVQQSIAALLKTPQNNLRVFKDGTNCKVDEQVMCFEYLDE